MLRLYYAASPFTISDVSSFRGNDNQDINSTPPILLCVLPEDPCHFQILRVKSPGPAFKEYLCFRNPDVAQALIIRWACLLIVDGWLPVMQQKITQHARTTVSLSPTDFDQAQIHARCDKWAVDITRSREYLLRPEVGFASTQFTGMPMTVAMGWFTKNRVNAKELEWFPVILARMRQVNAAHSDLMQRMIVRGGGGVAFRKMINQCQSPSTW